MQNSILFPENITPFHLAKLNRCFDKILWSLTYPAVSTTGSYHTPKAILNDKLNQSFNRVILITIKREVEAINLNFLLTC